MCAIVNPTSPMPDRPWSTYMTPHVVSLNRYGLRTNSGVSTRFIMKSPVGTVASAVKTMAVWYILLSHGYFAALRGAGALWPNALFKRVIASRASSLFNQIDQKSSQKLAWMMWYTIETVSTRPAIQWISIQLNCSPKTGADAVPRSVSIDAAMIQWNIRAASECRGTRAGTFAPAASFTGAVAGPSGFGQNFTNSECASMKPMPNANAT